MSGPYLVILYRIYKPELHSVTYLYLVQLRFCINRVLIIRMSPDMDKAKYRRLSWCHEADARAKCQCEQL